MEALQAPKFEILWIRDCVRVIFELVFVDGVDCLGGLESRSKYL